MRNCSLIFFWTLTNTWSSNIIDCQHPWTRQLIYPILRVGNSVHRDNSHVFYLTSNEIPNYVRTVSKRSFSRNKKIKVVFRIRTRHCVKDSILLGCVCGSLKFSRVHGRHIHGHCRFYYSLLLTSLCSQKWSLLVLRRAIAV